MKRGTTPVNVFHTNIDLTGAKVYVTYSQSGRVILEKTGDALEVTEDSVMVHLSQKDTLAFNASLHKVQMQMRYVTADGTADASNIMTADVEEVLKDGEISYV